MTKAAIAPSSATPKPPKEIAMMPLAFNIAIKKIASIGDAIQPADAQAAITELVAASQLDSERKKQRV